METSESRRGSSELDQSITTLDDSFMSEFRLPSGQNNLDLSQVSGWSAMTPGWNDSFRIHLSDSDDEASERVLAAAAAANFEEDQAMEVKDSLHELFVENCCTLYNDIQNFIDEIEFDEDQFQCVDELEQRRQRLMEQAVLLAESAPDLADIAHLRMQTIHRAMEQLKIKHSNDTTRSNSSKGHSSPVHELRKWLQAVETRLDAFRLEIVDKVLSISELQRLAADHQVLQLQIETEGQSLVSIAKKQLQTPNSCQPASSKRQEKRHRALESLEQRLLASWLKSLENLERIGVCLKQLQDNSTVDPESQSEDEEPLSKRRRTFSNISLPSSLSPLSPCSTVDSDVHLVPSSTASESGCLVDEDSDIIPFDPVQYRSIDESTMTAAVAEDTSLGLQQVWKKTTSSGSSSKLLDIGYSSGENSHDPASPSLSSGDVSPDSERRLRLKTTPTKSFYKTVPLDDAGITDNECAKLLPEPAPLDFELPTVDEPLSDSLIVQADPQSQSINDDYSEVMEMMDNDQLFASKLDQLRQGTCWRELVFKNKKISTQRRSLTELVDQSKDEGKSREASSEESDAGVKYPVFLQNPAALPPIPGRKRRFKKAVRQTPPSQTGSVDLKNSLSNVAMDESIYVYKEPRDDVMSQSLNSSFNDSTARKALLSKRKMDRSRMHRSASDHVNLNLNLNFYDMSKSYHSQHSTTSVFASFLPPMGSPLMSSTMKRSGSVHRRQSVESVASSTSSGTVHESGDAHYEWDEYRDPPCLPEMDTLADTDPTTSSKSSILDDTIIDEDFQSQLSLPDPSVVEIALNESNRNLHEVKRLMYDYDALNEEKEEIRSALRVTAKRNVEKLTAIVHASPRNINMDQINDVEDLRKQWHGALEELGPDPVDVEMEHDVAMVKDIQEHLSEIKDILKKLMTTSDAQFIKIEDLDAFIQERQQLWASLMQNKRVLSDIAASTGNSYHNGELFMLLRYVEESLGFVGQGTDTLAESMVKYQSAGDIKQALNDLEQQIDASANDPALDEDIQIELDVCQGRLDALENVCNNLTSQLGDIAVLEGKTKPGRQTHFWRQLKGFKSDFQRLKTKFGEMQRAQKVTSTATLTLPKKTETLLPAGTFGCQIRKRGETAPKKGAPSTTSNASDSTTASTSSKIQAAAPGVLGRTLKTVKDSRLVQVLLGFTGLLILSLIFVSFYLEDSPQNNWKRMFGPQLDYVNGPPPS